jgi:hypothetical protein
MIKPGQQATWHTEYGLRVPVRVICIFGKHDANVRILEDTFDEIAGFKANDVYTVTRSQLQANRRRK